MKKAFTLSEVLLALAIVGVLATMVIPTVMNNMQKKILTSQLKNSYQAIQDLAQEQIARSPSKNLKDSEFATGIINSNNFDISYNCSASKKCWADNYKTLNSESVSISQDGAKLKNGAAIKYIVEENPQDAPFNNNNKEFYIGTFYIDVNGAEKPNILGLDLYAFRVTDKGRLGDNSANTKTKEELLTACQNAETNTACTTYLETNGWNMDY